MCVYLLRLLISLPVDLDLVPGSFFLISPLDIKRLWGLQTVCNPCIMLVVCHLRPMKEQKVTLCIWIGGESWSNFTFTLAFAIWASEIEDFAARNLIMLVHVAGQCVNKTQIQAGSDWIRRVIRIGSGAQQWDQEENVTGSLRPSSLFFFFFEFMLRQTMVNVEISGEKKSPVLHLVHILESLCHRDAACFWLIPSALWVQVQIFYLFFVTRLCFRSNSTFQRNNKTKKK